ncbi:MAG: endonuclease [Dysgonamonadaceae bacterium]|jgi:predicted extracellular nuclease|nr:endonuclease [Dysgonamonadaceae bacterium]
MKPNLILILFLFLFIAPITAQNTFRVLFYNVENLFDVLDDPDKEDDEFTPNGIRYWNNKRYYNKLNNLAKVITALGGWDIPALIGLCEVENEKVVHDLTSYSPLRKMQYRYVMTESPDARGIDVALLYRRDRFKYLHHHCIRITFPHNRQKKTRDVLHVTGQIITGDTLDVFVCHFPSRRGGQMESEPDRIHVASIVRSTVDSLKNSRQTANILIMGDFNDEPSDTSLAQTLTGTDLYNLFLPLSKNSYTGSYKFGDRWNFLDQMIVSGHLLDTRNAFHVMEKTATIFQADFLLTDDRTNGGRRPKKTFNGRRYEGGYSDHLPVFVDFGIK